MYIVLLLFAIHFLQYGVNGMWIDIPSNVSKSYALHIPANQLLRFVPDENFFGSATLTVLAVDGKLCM